MSLTERLAKTFRANRRKWLTGRFVASIGGYGGFRCRISELRKRGMRIVCDVRPVKRRNGTWASTSFYRYEGKAS